MTSTPQQPIVGEVWKHTKTGGHYEIIGASYNVATDAVDVVYRPLYQSDFQRFNRPMHNHPKAWLFPNADGTARFVRVGRANSKHLIEWYAEPERQS